MAKHIDLTGQKFGRLFVVGLHHTEQVYSKGQKDGLKYYYTCQCDCGKETIVCTQNLKYGHTKSCGCLVKETVANINKTHNMAKTRLYKIWKGIKTRCFNTNDKGYKNYGGRGITMCPEWKDDFMAFHDWAFDNGYEEGLSIDRINNNGNYEPSNCRWVDNITQQNNRRVNRYLTFNGETHTYREWSRITGINHCTISVRINKYGWSVEKALTTPPRNKC